MGSDSAIQNNYVKHSLPDGKITQLAKDIVIGWAGDHRTTQFFFDSWPVNKRGQREVSALRKDPEKFLRRRMVEFTSECHDAHIKIPDAENGNLCLLVGVGGEIIAVTQSFGTEHRAPVNGGYVFWSIGSGAEAALSALHTLARTCPTMRPQERLEIALEGAAKFCCGVRAPFYFLNT